ncbi:uncharacterized protein SPPG_04989 [Spizellomyces punctatus DAOM BR117]|uniref:Nucleotide exchange factor Fes1 domain-containing protein n=1 Tax=Spizellomyces punctatus (strain DAOM BR117) TaxID=645134 RepID=A0A0L0HF12_SPIPD|nr:uncharacterized protein SPPG_04989 [Spizellomyces punctatus DAOM BR117]KNC99601.1 hypothetical protein SPPG_04989 [Spizellomyces punctatus DAOM BR117]|eukprot:XP_016607641.1 hypothetical protein SPPG_04989 [Spizellomyces punctatus DAOM BR117]
MPNRPTQSELLQWAVTHTTDESSAIPERPVTREPIDPKWIDVILGKDDAVKMKECVETIRGTEKSLDDKLAAFDELEMLVESLDNANDLRPLSLWTPIIDQLSSQEPKMRMYAAWVLGTAVQNNPRSQTDFLDSGGLGPILRVLASDPDEEVRAKALYCVSGAIRHNRALFDAFVDGNGFRTLASVAGDANPALLKRVVFLWRSLIEQEEPEVASRAVQAAQENGVPAMALDQTAGETEDADLVEKCLELLFTLVTKYRSTLLIDLLVRIRDEIIPIVRERFGPQSHSGMVSLDLIKQLEEALEAI